MIVIAGDLHGNPEALKKIVTSLELTDSRLEWCAADTVFILTGDVCDRGRDSASIYRQLMAWQGAAPAFNSELIFLIGNHEVMNIQGDYYYNTRRETAGYSSRSGGSGIKEKAEAFSPGGWLYEWLVKQRFIVKAGPFITAHADFPAEYRDMRLEDIEAESRRLFHDSSGLSDIDPLLWSRQARSRRPGYGAALEHFLSLNGAESWVCGHTPSMKGLIRTSFSGRYICVDTAMGFEPDNVSALVYSQGLIRAVYPGHGGKAVYSKLKVED